MIRTFSLTLFVLFTLILVACTAAQPPTAVPSPASNETTDPAAQSESSLARTDAQGAVEFTVEPLNLEAPGETLEFAVLMDTHSVDLSWDLAAQSVLASNTGLEVAGIGWPGGSGHHVEGVLVFPAKTADGQPLLADTKLLTLTIRDAGADERVFVWEVLP